MRLKRTPDFRLGTEPRPVKICAPQRHRDRTEFSSGFAADTRAPPPYRTQQSLSLPLGSSRSLVTRCDPGVRPGGRSQRRESARRLAVPRDRAEAHASRAHAAGRVRLRRGTAPTALRLRTLCGSVGAWTHDSAVRLAIAVSPSPSSPSSPGTRGPGPAGRPGARRRRRPLRRRCRTGA